MRSWYETNRPDRVLTKVGYSDEGYDIHTAPNWEEVFVRQNRKYKAVEAAAITSKKITFFQEEVREKYLKTENDFYKQDMRRIVFLTDKQTNETISFIMHIVPDLKYLEKTSLQPFRKMTYLERDPEYSGYVLYYELDGSYANGWRYDQGKVTNGVDYISDFSEETSVVTKSSDCRDVAVYQYIEYCTDYYQYVEFGGVGSGSYEGTSCTYFYEFIGVYRQCSSSTPIPLRPGQNSGNYEPLMGEYSLLYDAHTSSLSDVDKRTLKYSFKEFESRSVIYKTIIEKLKEAKAKFVFLTGQTIDNALAQYEYGRITFAHSGCISFGALEEELLHGVQHKIYYGNTMNSKYTNYEFEVKVFKDIHCLLFDDKGGAGQSGSMGQSDEFGVEYNRLLKDVSSKNKFDYSHYNQYHELAKKWVGRVGTYYNSNIDPKMLVGLFNN